MGVASKIPVRGGGTRAAGGTGRLVTGGPGSERQYPEPKPERGTPRNREKNLFLPEREFPHLVDADLDRVPFPEFPG
jgi:hypothetical protein